MIRIIVEGCGDWAMKYLEALKGVKSGTLGVFFTYDSTFGLDAAAEKLPADLFLSYLQATFRNISRIGKEGFATWDVKDTLFRLQGRSKNSLREMLPTNPDAVFVVTPDRTHCDVAEFWLGRARRIFVEKPFDASTGRIEEFCRKLAMQSYTEVYALDHYFLRCNQAAADDDYFVNRLLKKGRSGELQGDFESFEFYMTEPPQKDADGNYNPTSMRERALSLQEGMVFDMGAHALPVLLPFITIEEPVILTEVWAGMSAGLRSILFSGAETFAAASVTCRTRHTSLKDSSHEVSGKLVVGKDVGDRPMKHMRIRGPGGSLFFDLDAYHVYQDDRQGRRTALASLQQNWAQFLIKEVVEGRVPQSVEKFRPGGALRVVRFLEQWRNACRPNPRECALQYYQPGEGINSLMGPNYRMK